MFSVWYTITMILGLIVLGFETTINNATTELLSEIKIKNTEHLDKYYTPAVTSLTY